MEAAPEHVTLEKRRTLATAEEGAAAQPTPHDAKSDAESEVDPANLVQLASEYMLI